MPWVIQPGVEQAQALQFVDAELMSNAAGLCYRLLRRNYFKNNNLNIQRYSTRLGHVQVEEIMFLSYSPAERFAFLRKAMGSLEAHHSLYLHGMLEVPALQNVLGDLLFLVRVQLDELAEVSLGEGKESDGAAGRRLCMGDVAHAKEEPHFAYHLHTRRCEVGTNACFANFLR